MKLCSSDNHIALTELKNTPSNPHFGKGSEMTYFLSGRRTLTLCLLSYLNNIDSNEKITFVMQITDENGVERLDLQLKMNENSKITVDFFLKPTNSFTYVMPSTCYPSIQ